MPEIRANDEGEAEGSFYVKNLTVDKNNPIVGHAIIVHGGPDNVQKKSPPRIACGVVYQ